MTIKVIKPFNDRENDLAFCDIGTELEVTEQRGKFLIDNGYAEEVTEAPEQPAEETPKPKRTRKKAEQTD